MFKQAGTNVATRMFILDKDIKGGNVFDGQINQDLSSITDYNELFDRVNEIETVPRPDVSIAGHEVGLNTEDKNGKFLAEFNDFTSGKAKKLGKRELKKLTEKYFGEVQTKRDMWNTTVYSFDNSRERNSFFKAILEATQPKKGQLAKLTKEPAKGVEPKAVQDEIAKFQKEYAGVAPVTISVVQSQKDVPVDLAPGEKIKAVYNPSDISLVMVAENFNSTQEVREALQHELVVHYGLRSLMGRERYNLHMDRLLRSKDKKLTAAIESVKDTYKGHIDLDSKSGQRILAEEALAHIAEGDLQVGPLRRFTNAILKAMKTLRLIPDTATYTDAVNLIKSNAQGLRSRAIDVTEVRTEDVESFDQTPYLASLNSEATIASTPATDEMKSGMRKVQYTGDKRSFVEKVTDALSINKRSLKQGTLDQFHSLKFLEIEKYGELQSAENSAYKMAGLSTDANAMAETVFKHGVFKYDNGEIVMRDDVKPLQEIVGQVTDVNPDLLPMWEYYLAGKRVKDQKLIEQGKEKLFTKEMIAELDAYMDANPETKALFESAQKDLQKFFRAVMDFAQDSGLVNAEQRALWEKDSYVPFNRVSEEAGRMGPYAKKGLEGQSAGIRKLTGGEGQLDIMESIVQNTVHLVTSSYKNRAMQEVIKTTEGMIVEEIKPGKTTIAKSEGIEGETEVMQPVPMGWKPVEIDNAQIAKSLKNIGIEFDALTADEKKQYSTMFQMNAPQGENIVSVMKDGKRQYYEVNDPLLLASVASIGPQTVSEITRMMGMPKRLLTSMVTSTPDFILRNIIRDVTSNWVQADKITGTSVKESVLDVTLMRPMGRSFKGFSKSVKESPERWKILAGGGMSGEYFGSTKEGITKDIVKPNKKNLLAQYKKLVRGSEEATRIAVYEQAKANGASDMEATYQAKNVMNFSRSGQYEVVKFLIGTVPFMNARLQGLERMYTGAKANPASFALRGAMITAATMALLAMNDDREEYWALPEWDRDMNWHVWVGGQHIRIPKPFEFGAVFATLPERTYEAATREEKVFLSRMGSMLTDTFSFNPIPQALSPIAEQIANKNFFFDRPIVSMSLENLKPEMQFTHKTGAVPKMISQIMPDWAPDWMRSPVRIEHIIRGYFGSVGGYVMSASDAMSNMVSDTATKPAKKLGDYPVFRSFFPVEDRGSKYIGRFYDMTDQAAKAYSTVRELKDQNRLDEARAQKEKYGSILKIRRRLNRVRSRLTNINNQMNKIHANRIMSAEAKRKKLDQLTRKKNEMTKEISEKYWKLF
jgi:hypothetical protein